MLLEVKNISAGFGKKVVVDNVSLHLDTGELVSLIGHNGAGKSATLKAVMGVIKVREGQVLFQGKDITNRSPSANVKDGICFIPQERNIFKTLTVAENLEVAGGLLPRDKFDERLASVFESFPLLSKITKQKAGNLSGGQQQTLALGISLMLDPKLLILDEPSIGLAPGLALEVIEQVKEINVRLKLAVLLVEHRLIEAIGISDRVYIMRAGKMERESNAKDLLEQKKTWELF